MHILSRLGLGTLRSHIYVWSVLKCCSDVINEHWYIITCVYTKIPNHATKLACHLAQLLIIGERYSIKASLIQEMICFFGSPYLSPLCNYITSDFWSLARPYSDAWFSKLKCEGNWPSPLLWLHPHCVMVVCSRKCPVSMVVHFIPISVVHCMTAYFSFLVTPLSDKF